MRLPVFGLPRDAAEFYRNFIKLAAPGHEKYIEYANEKLLIENVIQAVCDTMSVDRNRVTLNTAVKVDLGADALLFCEVLAHLEEKRRFRFSDNQVEHLRTVGDIVDCIRTQLSSGRIG